MTAINAMSDRAPRIGGAIRWTMLGLVGALLVAAPYRATASGTSRETAVSRARSCDLEAAGVWITRWFTAWELTRTEILHLPKAPPPTLVFYDSLCVYTTSDVTAPGRVQPGPMLGGVALPWHATVHGDSLLLPDHERVAVQLMSSTMSDPQTGPFFVMAAPTYWRQRAHVEEPGLTAVFLHEFAHTRQVRGVNKVIDPIDSTWKSPEPLDDNVVQAHFGSDSEYVQQYRMERDLLYRAAAETSTAGLRDLAGQALRMMKARHARWFTGSNAVYTLLDDTWLSMEGAGQWTGYAWLAHPRGGGLTRAAAADLIRGGHHWSQDEGFGLFLVVDRLLPTWPSLVFHEPSMGATELLQTALTQ